MWSKLKAMASPDERQLQALDAAKSIWQDMYNAEVARVKDVEKKLTQTQTEIKTEDTEAVEAKPTETTTAVDSQGNPIDKDGKYILEDVAVEELTDRDFSTPTRNVRLPRLSQKVNDTIGANGRPVIIKKNIFEKNKKNHKDLSAEDSRKILTECLYNPQLYGQNQKVSRPYNWILIHLKDGKSAVIVEVNPTKDNIEIVNWHYLRDETLRQKESQAVKEGGLILTLSEDNAAGTTAKDGLVFAGKGSEVSGNKQENEKKSVGSKDKTQFSIVDQARDAEYVQTVKDGDMEKAQQLVDDAAKNWGAIADEDGNPLRMYHGTKLLEYYFKDGRPYVNPIQKFTVFKSGFFTPSRHAALGFANGAKHKVYDCYVKMNNPLVVDAKGADYDNITLDDGTVTTTDRIVNEAKYRGLYDGVIIKNVSGENNTTQTGIIDDYIPFVSSNIKLADTITYDNNGNVIPLSERFKEAHPDIRFSLGDPAETFEERQRRAVENKGTVMPGLNDAEVKIVDVPKHDFTGTGAQAIAKAEAWAYDNIIGNHTAHKGNVGEFEYELTGNAIKKFLSNSSTQNSDNLGIHLAVLKKLPEIINESIEVEEHPDYKKVNRVREASNGINDNSLLVHRMYSAVNIDGKTYRVKTTIHERSIGENAPHDYRVTKIELPISGSSTSNALDNSNNLDGVPAFKMGYYPVAKLLQNVEKSYDKGKKILDESKKNSVTPSGARYSVADEARSGVEHLIPGERAALDAIGRMHDTLQGRFDATKVKSTLLFRVYFSCIIFSTASFIYSLDSFVVFTSRDFEAKIF